MEDDEPCAKRKKQMSGREIIEKLESNENDVKKAVGEMVEELCPFDVNDEDALKIEDRTERLEKVTKVLMARVYKLRKEVKERKFKHKSECLEEPMISCSQYSIFVLDISNDYQGAQGGLGSFLPVGLIFRANESGLEPKWVAETLQSCPLYSMLVYSTPVKCLGVILSFSVH